MRNMIKLFGSWLVLTLVVGCGDDVHPQPSAQLPRGEWGELVKVLDRTGPLLFGTQSAHEPPVFEAGGYVLAKVVVGAVDVSSSDSTTFEIGAVEERAVGTWCEPRFLLYGEPECGTDYDTWFEIRTHAEGDAELIVRAQSGDSRRLPLRVAAPDRVELTYTELAGQAEGVIPMENFGDAIVLGEEGSDTPTGIVFGLRMLDVEGHEIISHLVWTLEQPGLAEFIELWGPPSATSDSFWHVEPQRHEGKVPILWPLQRGIMTLRVETSGGLVVETPLWSTIQQAPYCELTAEGCG